MNCVVGPLFSVMFTQSFFQTRQWVDLVSPCAPKALADQFSHDEVDVFQFPLCSPSVILALPLFSGLEPHCKCFCEVFCGMGLCVPCIQIEHVVATAGLWLIPFRVGYSIRSEDICPARLRMKLECVIDGVAGFVPQNPHTIAFTRTLNLKHLSAFELHET